MSRQTFNHSATFTIKAPDNNPLDNLGVAGFIVKRDGKYSFVAEKDVQFVETENGIKMIHDLNKPQ